MNTRDEIISEAIILIKQKGYHSWSYDHISKKIGIKKASIHYYFPSKENLIAEVLQIYIDSLFSQLDRLANHLPANQDKLKGLIDIYRNAYINPKEICLCTILAADYQTLSEEILSKLRNFYLRLHEWIVQILNEGIQTKEFRSSVEVESVADLIVHTLQGLLVTSKILADQRSFENNIHQLLSLLK